MSWIVDASVAVKWFIEDEVHPHAEAVLERLAESPSSFAVPELFAFETYSVLMRVHSSGLSAFNDGIMPILQAGVLRYPMTRSLAKSAFDFVDAGLAGYDACYAALARQLESTWLTFDRRAHEQIEDGRISWCIDAGLPGGWPEKR